eukprot:5766610-Prymnesium_polylepis.1
MGALSQYEYVWLLDTDAFILGPLPYDVFGYMAATNATFGYVDVNVETPAVADGLADWMADYLRARPALQPTLLPRFSPRASAGTPTEAVFVLAAELLDCASLRWRRWPVGRLQVLHQLPRRAHLVWTVGRVSRFLRARRP